MKALRLRGLGGGRDENIVRDQNCGCCIQHYASSRCRSGQVSAASTILSAAADLRVYNWTGCYLGAQLGGAFADNHVNGNFNTIVPVSPNGDGTGGGIVILTTPLANNAGSTAVTAGGQGGCDLQFARNWVIGAQLDGAWTHLSGSQGINGSAGLSEQGHIDLTANALIKADILATATGRIGYAVNYDDIAGLFYLKGGAAFVNYDTSNITGNNAVTTCADAFDLPKGLYGLSVRRITHSISMLRRQTVWAGQLAWVRSGWLMAIGQSSASGII